MAWIRRTVSAVQPMVTCINSKQNPRCFFRNAQNPAIAMLRYRSSHIEEANTENWLRRVDLAAAYRDTIKANTLLGFEYYDLHEGVCNHLTMMAPAKSGQGQVMLLGPHGLHWKEVTASSLIGLDSDMRVVEPGNGMRADVTAATIHKGVHDARPDATCVFHLHPPYATAMGMLKKKPFGMYSQNACLFYNSFVYDTEYNGLSHCLDEGKRLAEKLGDKRLLFMCNHGVLLAASTADRAFDDIYYLERACMYQILAMSSGEELLEISDEISRVTYDQLDAPGERQVYCKPHFESIKRLIAHHWPDYRS